jgi:hypothetical protein
MKLLVIIPSHSDPVYTKLTVASLIKSVGATHDLNIHVGVHSNYSDYTKDLSLFEELRGVAQIHCVDEIDWMAHFDDNYRYSKMHCKNVLNLLKNCRYYDFDYCLHLDNDTHITGDFVTALVGLGADLAFEFFGADSVRLVTTERTQTGYNGRVQFAPKPAAWHIAFSRRLYDRMITDPSCFSPQVISDKDTLVAMSRLYDLADTETPVMFDTFAMLLHMSRHVWKDIKSVDVGDLFSRHIRHFFLSSFNYGKLINHNSDGHLEPARIYAQEFPYGIPTLYHHTPETPIESETLLALKDLAAPHIGRLVISMFEVVRLSGVEEDNEDCWWVFDTLSGITKMSCAVSWTPLWGRLSDNEYDRINNLWNINKQK